MPYIQWLDLFLKARDGDQHMRAVLDRYSRMIATKRDKETFKHMLRAEAVRPVPAHLSSLE